MREDVSQGEGKVRIPEDVPTWRGGIRPDMRERGASFDNFLDSTRSRELRSAPMSFAYHRLPGLDQMPAMKQFLGGPSGPLRAVHGRQGFSVFSPRETMAVSARLPEVLPNGASVASFKSARPLTPSRS
jgi:hypothetical protein